MKGKYEKDSGRSSKVTPSCNYVACSAGVFFERTICSRKRYVETSRREEEMGRVKGSGEGEGAGRENIPTV